MKGISCMQAKKETVANVFARSFPCYRLERNDFESVNLSRTDLNSANKAYHRKRVGNTDSTWSSKSWSFDKLEPVGHSLKSFGYLLPRQNVSSRLWMNASLRTDCISKLGTKNIFTRSWYFCQPRIK